MDVDVSRRMLLLGAIAGLAIAPAASAKPLGKSPKILFVCQFGTVKSPIAREILRKRASEQGILLSVAARGITPEKHLPETLRQRLAVDGINPAAEPLKKLQRRDIANADVVVAFDPLPSNFAPRGLVDWTDLPSMVSDYPRARAELDARIDRLLKELSKAH